MLKILTSDKALHFLYSYFLASIWLPLGIGFAIGKEVYDWFKYGRKFGLVKFLPMTVGDLIADGIGIIMGIILVLGVRHGIF